MRVILALILALAVLPVSFARADGHGPSPVVIELFTSQGCSACPPADAMLAELATRDDVIALALHVDYWDYIGWADTFANPQFTRRQHAYARAAGSRMVYTPQMIVGGVDHVVGYEPMDVADHIIAHRELDYPVQVTLIRNAAGALILRAEASMVVEGAGMVVQLVHYSASEQVEIRRGENAGRSLTYVNIVREWVHLSDEWTGADPFEMQLVDVSPGPVVALVQMPGPGVILGAARLE